ncbi:MAG: hypothetical protein E7020_00420 [Alphaproteobacteria bacterium]|nr:hypothetical protein [Alphaproteobacteria bacterium]
MNGKLKYDLVFSLGEACSCTQALRSSNLQYASYPLDWLFGSDFNGRMDILVSDFNKFIEQSDLQYSYSERSISCDAYLNNKNQITFNHDFPAGISLEESYPMVAEKYQRRINRLLDNIKNADSVLIVYIEIPNNENHTSDKDIICGWEKIKEKYFNKKIDLLYFMNDTTLPPKSVKKENITSNITKVTANYKNQAPNVVPYAVDNDVLKRVLKQCK